MITTQQGLDSRKGYILIVIFDAQGAEMTDGRRPLDPRGWFAKATKALINKIKNADLPAAKAMARAAASQPRAVPRPTPRPRRRTPPGPPPR